MGSSGDFPTGFTGREARTLFLRVPYRDWAAIKQGYKTEFRTRPLGAISTSLHVPTPIVAYVVSPQRHHRDHKLMVLLDHRTERLIEISESPESLAREGFPDYSSFKRYWRERTRRPFRALDRVSVFQLGPWQPSERSRLGTVLIDRLYGNYLDQ